MENEAIDVTDVEPEDVTRLENALIAFNKEFPIARYEDRPVCIPGVGDVFIRKISRLGYKGEYPRAYDWENLIPQLREDEELLWIVRKRGCREFAQVEKQTGLVEQFAFEIYFGLKFVGKAPRTQEEFEDRGRRFAVLTRHFAKSAFPESQMECFGERSEFATARLLEEISAMREARIVAGMPSVKDADLKDVSAKRDENVRPYAGLNDFLDMHGGPEDNFAVVFSISRARGEKIQQNFNALFTIQNQIQPLLKNVVQYSEGQTIGKTHSEGEGTDDATPEGKREIKVQEDVWKRIDRRLGNACRYFKSLDNEQLESIKRTTKIGVMEHHTTQDSTSESKQTNKTWSVTEANSALAFMDDRIKEMLGQLTQSFGTGGYSCGAVVYADTRFAVESISGAMCATMSGGHSALHPMRTYSFPSKENRDWLLRKKSLSDVFDEIGIQAGILNCEKACLYLPVPTTHMIGLPLKKTIFYGKERTNVTRENGVRIGSMAFSEPHVSNEHTHFFSRANHLIMQMPPEDLFSHLFVVGTTGCGKTKRAAKLLDASDSFRRIIIETAKKTYWQELGFPPSDLKIYTLGDSTHNPLRFNPFFFEEGTSLKQHISVLADAVSDLLPMEALIGPKLREAIERCYTVCGWDIESNKWHQNGCKMKYPDVTLFNLMVARVAEQMSDYSAEVQGNYKGALLNRAAIFMDAVYQDIFAFDGNKTIDELFPRDDQGRYKTVIIEMEEMPPSEINMPAFIISLLLHRIRAYQNKLSKEGGLKERPGFLIAIEEAHNVLSRSIESKGDESQSGKGGHLVKQVTRMLAEGRGLKLGLMIIDQSAANIAPSVIANTNSKFVFRQEDGTEIETIGKAIGLKSDEWNDLQLLERGECLFRSSKYPQPVKMAAIPESEMGCKPDDKDRDKFVPKADWQPSYHKAEECLRKFITHDGIIVNSEGRRSFPGYEGEAFHEVSKTLEKLTTEVWDNSKVIHEDLERYMKIKALLSFKYYSTAEFELGIQ